MQLVVVTSNMGFLAQCMGLRIPRVQRGRNRFAHIHSIAGGYGSLIAAYGRAAIFEEADYE